MTLGADGTHSKGARFRMCIPLKVRLAVTLEGGLGTRPDEKEEVKRPVCKAYYDTLYSFRKQLKYM